MSKELPKFLVVHFDGDFLEHAEFANSEQEAEEISCAVRPGDHWDMVRIPIETAAASPDLLDLIMRIKRHLDGGGSIQPENGIHIAIRANIKKATE